MTHGCWNGACRPEPSGGARADGEPHAASFPHTLMRSRSAFRRRLGRSRSCCGVQTMLAGRPPLPPLWALGFKYHTKHSVSQSFVEVRPGDHIQPFPPFLAAAAFALRCSLVRPCSSAFPPASQLLLVARLLMRVAGCTAAQGIVRNFSASGTPLAQVVIENYFDSGQ